MAEPAPHPVDDPELRAERAFLAQARAALADMYQEVLAYETLLIGGEDNDERFTNESYQRARHLRAQALVDMPDVPLFFGRLDYEPGVVEDADRIYVGRRHVRDDAGRPLIVDWRAPVAVPFYRATRDDRQGVLRRRRYGFSDDAELTAYDDEVLDSATPATGADALLRAEIERPRTGPMRDIVATIQPDQDDLVRAPLQPSLCVQGAPGTGKTAVGLHRIAYLLYTERERLRRGGVVIVGPNRSFLSYIRRVLPALGEVDVTQTTVDELIGQGRPSVPEDPTTARIKGDARMATVLNRALWSHVGSPSEGVMYAKGARRYRVPDYEVKEIVDAFRGTTRYADGRNSVAQRLAHAVLVRMERRGEAPDDRVQDAVARSKPVKQLLDEVWPKLVPERVLFRLLSDADFLALSAQGLLTSEEQAALLWSKRPRSWKSARWSDADIVLLDELADLMERRPGSLGHLVVDEAQDLSPMQLRALHRRCRTGSMTVLGDLAQATAPWATDSWDQVLEHLGVPDARLVELDRGFRVPAQITEVAARLLPAIAPGLRPPTGVREVPDAYEVVETSERELLDRVVAACRTALDGDGSVGVIAADAEIAAVHEGLTAADLGPALLGVTEDAMESARLVCVPATLAKGLEFDTVVIVEPTRIVDAEPRGLHRLYVTLTRAVTRLVVVHARPLPAILQGDA